MTTTTLPVPVSQAAAPVAPGETSSSAIAAREKAAVEARFLMAINRPRLFDQCRLRLLDACRRPKFADAARYAKPVGNSRVTGFSIRFAEEARVLWGNIDVSAFLVFDDDAHRIYRVIGTDLETNATEGMDVMIEKFVERKKVREGMEVMGARQNTGGETVYRIRATEDDLVVKVNAQLSKARRNVILSLIPADVKEECEDLCLLTVRDQDAKDPDAARRAILDAFWTLGVTPAQISDVLDHPLEQINPAELTLLRTYYRALKEGEATWTEIVEAHTGGRTPAGAETPTPTAAARPKGNGTDALRATLQQRTAAKPGPLPAAVDDELAAELRRQDAEDTAAETTPETEAA